MARQVKVFVTCDLCSAEVDEDDPQITHAFAYDGVNYELDLCAQHSSAFINQMMEYVTAGTEVKPKPVARRTSGEPKAPREGTKAADAARRKTELAAIRQWANLNGYEVGDRGRISTEVEAAYRNATGIGLPPPEAPEPVPQPAAYPDMWDEEGDDFAPAVAGGTRNPDGSPAS